jgi:uncharacterized protein YqeY
MNLSQLDNELSVAIKSKDKLRVDVLRLIKSALKNEMIAKMVKDLSEQEITIVIRRFAKQLRDALADFEKGKRADLIEKTHSELKIVESYLPASLNTEDVRAMILKKKSELGITDKKDLGRLIGAVMKEIAGRADGGLVKQLAEEIF